MKPNETNNHSNIPLLNNRGSTKKIIGDHGVSKQQDAAANLIRHQIDNIFEKQHHENSQSVPANTQIHQDNQQHVEIQSDQWQKYHSAWQDYYRRYYEGFYGHQFKLAEKNIDEKYKGTHYQEKYKKRVENEKLAELKQKLLDKVQASAFKARKSRHFIPLISAVIVVLIFLFLQYNRVIISNVVAYVSPGSIDPQNIVIDPKSEVAVTPDPKLIIPKINVDVPVVYDIGNDYNSQMSAMTKGVAHFAIPGASSHPGQIGNTVIAGHSSNDLLDSGDYKFIFAQLDKLSEGDVIYANYQSKRYSYTVTKKEVVNPTELNKLTYATTKPVLTLITCTPLGTSKYRLLVTAEQVSPDPAQATANSDTASTTKSSIPGNSPTLIERIFGGGNN